MAPKVEGWRWQVPWWLLAVLAVVDAMRVEAAVLGFNQTST